MSAKRKKNFVCTQCSKCFIDNAHLKEHEVKHTKEKSFVCTVCNKRFARSGSLRVHSKTHSGETIEYVCPYDDCSRKYTSRSGYINHQKKHTECHDHSITAIPVQPIPEPNSLPITDPVYNQPTTIEQQKEDYECPMAGCTKTFSNESSLNFHTYRVHLGIDSSVCSKTRCIQLRKSYLKQQIEIQKMRERIKQLESMTSLLSRKDKQEFEREYNRQHYQQQNANIPVIPVYYLEEEKPYICGIPKCCQRFSTYKLLQFHAKSHPSSPLDLVMNQQPSLPDGPVHCPVLGCEYGVDQKPMASFFVLKKHYRRVHQKKVSDEMMIQRIGNTVSTTNELLNELVKEGAVVIQNATVISDVSIDHSNVNVGSVNCNQVIETQPTTLSHQHSFQTDDVQSSQGVSNPVTPVPTSIQCDPMANTIDILPLEYSASSLWLIVCYTKRVCILEDTYSDKKVPSAHR